MARKRISQNAVNSIIAKIPANAAQNNTAIHVVEEPAKKAEWTNDLGVTLHLGDGTRVAPQETVPLTATVKAALAAYDAATT